MSDSLPSSPFLTKKNRNPSAHAHVFPAPHSSLYVAPLPQGAVEGAMLLSTRMTLNRQPVRQI